jgi:nitrite reductase (NADH) small subunit
MTDGIDETVTAMSLDALDDSFEFVCQLNELELNRIRSAVVGGRDLCIVRTVAGIFTFGAVCPHQGGPMCEGLIKGTMTPSPRNEYSFAHEGEIVTCPWHGYEFDLRTGASVNAVIRGRIGAYPVAVRGQDVYCSSRRLRTRGTETR